MQKERWSLQVFGQKVLNTKRRTSSVGDWRTRRGSSALTAEWQTGSVKPRPKASLKVIQIQICGTGVSRNWGLTPAPKIFNEEWWPTHWNLGNPIFKQTGFSQTQNKIVLWKRPCIFYNLQSIGTTCQESNVLIIYNNDLGTPYFRNLLNGHGFNHAKLQYMFLIFLLHKQTNHFLS